MENDKKNKYYCNKSNNNLSNNINYKNKFNINSLLEVENFLCNLKNIKKTINIYKIFKN